jgi:hypothetical protein
MILKQKQTNKKICFFFNSVFYIVYRQWQIPSDGKKTHTTLWYALSIEDCVPTDDNKYKKIHNFYYKKNTFIRSIKTLVKKSQHIHFVVRKKR